MDKNNCKKGNRQNSLLKASYNSGVSKISPVTCSIGITSMCNSRCVYCDTWSSKEKTQTIKLERFKELLNSLKTIGVKDILLSGGEPLIHPDILDIVDSAIKMGFSTRIITNGIKSSKETMLKLVDIGISRIAVSIDSLDPETYRRTRGVPIDNCLKTLSILEKVKVKNPDFRIDMYPVINKHNIGDLLELQDYAKAKGFNISYQTLQSDPRIDGRIGDLWPNEDDILKLEKLIATIIDSKADGGPVNNLDSYLKDIPEFYRQKTNKPTECYAGYMRINIDEQLNVKTCWMMPPVGSLNVKSLVDIWSDDNPELNKNRVKIKNKQCPGCYFPCHVEENLSPGGRS